LRSNRFGSCNPVGRGRIEEPSSMINSSIDSGEQAKR